MPGRRFAQRLAERTDAALNRMAWQPSFRAPFARELLRPRPFDPPTEDVAAVLAAFAAKDVVWENGFPVALSLSGRAFVSGGDALFRAVPTIRAVRLVAVDPVRSELPGCPHLAKLSRLDLWGCQLGRDVVPLAGSPHLAGLVELNLSRNDLGDGEAVALAESPTLRSLQILNVSDNSRLTADGVARLRAGYATIIA